ncbi:uncharacterized protein LOC114240917 [Bombyx mandarina]|uniref:Uncharacterized protein LOC114240917 n=1 Tax=Bombyx mandarina TaxID=7092 RepID=A0A6J2JD46_BOMMA|nr:uncharacterized protein LOC114240917 [Bombyx mandarina]
MAKRKIDLFIEIKNEKEFKNILRTNSEALICAEVYSQFVGACTALDRLFTIIKYDWSNGKIILLKVPSDEVDSLRRFRDQSEPVYLFIFKQKVTNIFRGVDSIKFAEVAKREVNIYKKEIEGYESERPTYDLSEPTPDEIVWFNKLSMEKELEVAAQHDRRVARQAARKRHRAELMVPHLERINFVLFWPHCKHAHPELYEQWDLNGIIMIGREELNLTKEKAEDILYEGDAPINEASMQMLVSGTALAICFRLLDTDKHFVSLVRKILYEDIQQYDDDSSAKSFGTAFDHYKSYSQTKEKILLKRHEEKVTRKAEEKEKKSRRLSEMKRLALQALQEAIEAKRAKREQRKLKLLKAGDLTALQNLKEQPSDDELSFAQPQQPQESSSDTDSPSESNEEEYFPPPGLVIPGFYAPPNDIAKANGLAVLFPKIVVEYVTPEPEFLPPHVLVMLEAWKRHKALKVLSKYENAVIHVGIFEATTPYDGVHIAYSVMEFDADNTSQKTENVKIAIMLSIENDVPLLELMDLNPVHVSRDPVAGEEECSAMFPVDYADMKIDLKDFQLNK